METGNGTGKRRARERGRGCERGREGEAQEHLCIFSDNDLKTMRYKMELPVAAGTMRYKDHGSRALHGPEPSV